ncbi:lipocalin family protein [uncultured Psychroserpens sp.]|uniref:lipocalin family protein n=1 Tax=uncultured Psychroserpens sp. TaxID=255436 RepID=UPI002634B6E3|nr:lipocalin family protein [uncultured Psychroserpens sp.]
MKIIIKLCVLLIVFSLFSCSSDDDGDTTTSIEGTWVLSALRVESAFDFNEDGTASRNLFVETPCYNDDLIRFRSDGTVNIISALTSITVEVTSATEYEHVYECLDGFDTESTWTHDGNTITVENGNDDLVGTLSGNIMNVFVSDFFRIEMYDGMNFTYPNEDVTLVYTKQE